MVCMRTDGGSPIGYEVFHLVMRFAGKAAAVFSGAHLIKIRRA